MSAALPKIWCDEDEHSLYEHFADFNEWLDSEEGLSAQAEYGIGALPQPSKALFSGDRNGYEEAFREFRKARRHEALGEAYFLEQFGDDHWFQRNMDHFNQLVDLMYAGAVVPFVGAGISAAAGFSTWEEHLRRQGKTAHISSEHIEALLTSGAYETVLEEIEAARGWEVFIQEIRDEFSRNLTIPDEVWRISELFTDTVITTNYDRLLEQSFETGEAGRVHLINGTNALERPDPKKVTVIKLHGNILEPRRCILSKNQYDEAYGNGDLNMQKPIPKLLAYYYKNSSLLFLGCSLRNDRTVRVFKAIKESMGEEEEVKQHFSIEQAPENFEEIARRNADLAKLGITPIWFERERYEFVESILSLAKNELRHRGVPPPASTIENNPPVHLDLDLSHFLADFIDLMPLMRWLHQAVPKAATKQYLSAMQRVFYANSFATQQTNENLTHTLDNLLRALANTAKFDGYTHGKLTVAFEYIQQYLSSIGEQHYLGKSDWDFHELLTIPQSQFDSLLTQKIDGSFDYHAIRMIVALLQHGQNQRHSPKEFFELPGAVNNEFGDYLSLALTTNLGVIVPDRLNHIYSADIRGLCEVAWNSFDKPIDLKFFERVRLTVSQFFQ